MPGMPKAPVGDGDVLVADGYGCREELGCPVAEGHGQAAQ